MIKPSKGFSIPSNRVLSTADSSQRAPGRSSQRAPGKLDSFDHPATIRDFEPAYTEADLAREKAVDAHSAFMEQQLSQSYQAGELRVEVSLGGRAVAIRATDINPIDLSGIYYTNEGTTTYTSSDAVGMLIAASDAQNGITFFNLKADGTYERRSMSPAELLAEPAVKKTLTKEFDRAGRFGIDVDEIKMSENGFKEPYFVGLRFAATLHRSHGRNTEHTSDLDFSLLLHGNPNDGLAAMTVGSVEEDAREKRGYIYPPSTYQ